jgi:hypothetical protein
MAGLRLLGLVQPGIILAGAIVLGIALAPKVGLSAPYLEAIAEGHFETSGISTRLLIGIAGGILAGLFITFFTLLFQPLMSPQEVERISHFSKLLSVPTRLLYGGITEEILMRWGFMTVLVYLGWRFLRKRRTPPTTAVFVAAILLSSFTFAAGHLPIAFALLPGAGMAIVLFVLIANSAFGVVAGFLYWRRGLESAIFAHIVCHLVLLTASVAGAYF